MKKFYCLVNEDRTSAYVLLRDYGDSSSWTILCHSKTDTFVKTDKRIRTSDEKEASKKFEELYGYKMKLEQKLMKDIIY